MRVALAVLLVCSAPLQAQMRFGKVELRTNYAAAGAGENGSLIVARDRVEFTHREQSRFTIGPKSITEIFYSRVAGRRIKSAIGVGIVFFPAGIGLLFSKGKKHYVTLSFDEEGGEIGAVEFQLHKSNYRGTLRALEEVTGLTMMYDQEGVKASRETVASRGTSSRAVPLRNTELAAVALNRIAARDRDRQRVKPLPVEQIQHGSAYAGCVHGEQSPARHAAKPLLYAAHLVRVTRSQLEALQVSQGKCARRTFERFVLRRQDS